MIHFKGVDDRDGARLLAGGVVVEDEGGQLLGEGTHFGGEARGGGGVDVDEEVELAATQLAQRDEVGDALQKAGLAECTHVGRGVGVVACGAEQTGERDHRTKRIAVRAEMPGDEDAPGLGEQPPGRLIVRACFQFVHAPYIKPYISPLDECKKEVVNCLAQLVRGVCRGTIR